MHDLSLTLIQTPLHWQDPVANLAMFEEKMWQLEGDHDIVILPEMFSTGFSMRAPELAEAMGLTVFRWMKMQAGRLNAVVTGSYIVKENGNYYNRLVWMRPDGSYEYYDKRHLFRMASEQEIYSAGSERLVTEWKGWRICPMICYDLRFPVWSRNVWKNEVQRLDYDLLFYVANWPAPRHNAWTSLLRARAIENLCYTAGVNRLGEDGNGMDHLGGSMIFDMKGNELLDLGQGEAFQTVRLSAEELRNYREKFPAHLDADGFDIKG